MVNCTVRATTKALKKFDALTLSKVSLVLNSVTNMKKSIENLNIQKIQSLQETKAKLTCVILIAILPKHFFFHLFNHLRVSPLARTLTSPDNRKLGSELYTVFKLIKTELYIHFHSLYIQTVKQVILMEERHVPIQWVDMLICNRSVECN